MSDWGSYIDRQIRKAMEDGEFDNLPGEGKPLNIEEDENTPDAMRLAFKILKDNDLAPAWIMQGKDLIGCAQTGTGKKPIQQKCLWFFTGR